MTNLSKDINVQMKETEKTPIWINFMKSTPSHIIIRCVCTSMYVSKQTNKKASWKQQENYYTLPIGEK